MPDERSNNEVNPSYFNCLFNEISTQLHNKPNWKFKIIYFLYLCYFLFLIKESFLKKIPNQIDNVLHVDKHYFNQMIAKYRSNSLINLNQI